MYERGNKQGMHRIILYIIVLITLSLLVKRTLDRIPEQGAFQQKASQDARQTTVVPGYIDFHDNRPQYKPPIGLSTTSVDGDVISREYLFGFSSKQKREAFIDLAYERGFRILDRMNFAHAVRIGFDNESELKKLLQEGPDPVSQGPNHMVRIPSGFTQQPAEQTVPYESFGGTALSWLGVEKNNMQWGEGITVAVLDTGIIPHSFSMGRSVVHRNMLDPEDTGYNSYGVHGTAVASLIASNSDMFPGISPDVDIISVKVLTGDGIGDAFTLAKGIVDAVDHGADVVNLSLGSYGDNYLLRQAVDYAVAHDAAVVAAVGNDGVLGITYPARYEEVIAVTAVDAAGTHLHFSNKGEEIDLSAPGLDLYIQVGDKQVASFSGTSAAVPFVSGSIAHLLSENPDITALEAASLIVEYTNDTGLPGEDVETGHGILDTGRVLGKDRKGVYDIALMKPYVHEGTADAENITVSVSAQNRGTEMLNAVTVAVETSDSVYENTFHDVAVNQTVSYDFTIAKPSSQYADNVSISGTADLNNQKDVYPEDNTDFWKVTIMPLNP